MQVADLVQLLRRSNAGDSEAYHQLLSWLNEHALKQIRQALKSYASFPREAFDDICQDVLITFHQVHQTFDLERPFLPWINTIIRHKTIDFIRRKEFKAVMSSVDVEIIRETFAIEEDEARLGKEELLKLIDQLPHQQQQVLTLAKLEGHSSKDIALKLNLSDSNVKVMIHRAIKELKRRASSV